MGVRLCRCAEAVDSDLGLTIGVLALLPTEGGKQQRNERRGQAVLCPSRASTARCPLLCSAS